MKEQNFKNHSQVAPKSYYAAILLAFTVLVLTLINSKETIKNSGSSLIIVNIMWLAVGVIITAWYARAFALKAQDRAIRAEENLRHFALTGKLLDNRLAISQIIALRFAADEEFVALAKKAADENLTNKQIKQLIVNWKADWYRV
jgi:hypothetical protein